MDIIIIQKWMLFIWFLCNHPKLDEISIHFWISNILEAINQHLVYCLVSQTMSMYITTKHRCDTSVHFTQIQVKCTCTKWPGVLIRVTCTLKYTGHNWRAPTKTFLVLNWLTSMYSLSATSIACFGPMCNLDEAILSNSTVWRATGGDLVFCLALSSVILAFRLFLMRPKRRWATSLSKTPTRLHSRLIVTWPRLTYKQNAYNLTPKFKFQQLMHK